MDDNIQEYITKMREVGKSGGEIRSELLKAGWDKKDIPIANDDNQPQPTPHPEKPIKSPLKGFVISLIKVISIGLVCAIIFVVGVIVLFWIYNDENYNDPTILVNTIYIVVGIFAIIGIFLIVTNIGKYSRKHKIQPRSKLYLYFLVALSIIIPIIFFLIVKEFIK